MRGQLIEIDRSKFRGTWVTKKMRIFEGCVGHRFVIPVKQKEKQTLQPRQSSRHDTDAGFWLHYKLAGSPREQLTAHKMSLAMRKMSQQFLSGVSVTKMDFTDVVYELSNSTFGESHQDALLSLTIDHPLMKQYPLKTEYQQSFMRKLVKELEARGAEISGNLYERHIQILQEVNGEKVYRHFLLDNGSVISVRESVSIVSNGTTGLYIWQAAHVLINWCFKNADMLKNSTVLELGSGVGLCGIAVSHLCSAQRYIFSDCHPAVMNALVENVKINSGAEYSDQDSDSHLSPFNERVMWSGKLKETKVAVAHLPWEDIIDEHLAPAISPDFVIASDVVYDPGLFGVLSRTIKEFINTGSQVILACTERNSGTLQEFLKKLEALDLKLEEEDAPEPCIIPICNEWLVKIYKVSKP